MNLFSHVKWFTEPNDTSYSADIGLGTFFFILGFFLLAMAILIYIDSWIKSSGLAKNLDNKLKPLRPYVSTVVRFTTGILLIINGFHQFIFAPNIKVGTDITEELLSNALFVVGTFILLGFLTRIMSGALAALFIVSLFIVDPVGPLEHLEFIGIAGFLIFQGPGYLSIDRMLGLGASSFDRYNKLALPTLRQLTGFGLVFLAFSEKLFNISAAQAFLNQYDWNFLSYIGISDKGFIVFAGSMELIIGASLILNLATRLTTLSLLGIMTLTAILLGPTEVIGHLFAVGVVFAAWVHDTKPNKNVNILKKKRSKKKA